MDRFIRFIFLAALVIVFEDQSDIALKQDRMDIYIPLTLFYIMVAVLLVRSAYYDGIKDAQKKRR